MIVHRLWITDVKVRQTKLGNRKKTEWTGWFCLDLFLCSLRLLASSTGTCSSYRSKMRSLHNELIYGIIVVEK